MQRNSPITFIDAVIAGGPYKGRTIRECLAEGVPSLTDEQMAQAFAEAQREAA